jgi:ribosomal protein L7/L12
MSARVTERAVGLCHDGARWDTVLAPLRREGFSKVDSIKATVEVLRLPLADAKRLVHDSEAWPDVREHHDEWHNSLVAEVELGAPRD